jgi:hypothetical protein
MDDLHKALGDISNIRRQMAHSTEFRGYGPATLATTGLLALVTAGAQAVWVVDPASRVLTYLAMWTTTAILSAALIVTQMVTRSQRIHSGMADAMIRVAVEQFLPAAAAGALLTLVLLRNVPSALWMLPGLWQITYSLGVFSSCRFLPRPMGIAGAWYLFTGLACISLGDNRALSPWTMGISFGVGQLLVAAILLFAAKEARADG